MPKSPSIPATEIEGNSQAFTKMMRRLMGVSHDELKAKMEAEKAAKRTRPRRSASRASVSPSKAR